MLNDAACDPDDLELVYSHHQLLGDQENPETAIAQWHVEVRRFADDDSDTAEEKIGDVSIAVFNLALEVDWVDAGDALGTDAYYTCAAVLFDPSSGGMNEHLTERLAAYPNQVVLLDHMTLRPEVRGQGLGPLIATAVLRRLATAGDLIVAFPQPDGWQNMTEEELLRTRTKIEATWASVGFRPYRDGVWLRSLALAGPGWSA